MIKVIMKDGLNIAFHKWVVMPIIVAVFAGTAPSAQAHARLTRSVPEAGAQLTLSPARVELWFNELLDGGEFNTITVLPSSEGPAANRISLSTGKAEVDGKERTHLTIDLKPLPPGEYTVEWRVLSLDGHSAPGRFKFKITATK